VIRRTKIRPVPTRPRLISAGLFFALTGVLATQQAQAADDVTLQEVRDLKAKLKLLEKRLDAQQVQVTKQSKILKTAAPLTPMGTPVAYEPPQPWDKKIHFNGITITPGGFFAMEGVWRSHGQGADIGDVPFGSIPFPATSQLGHTNETRFSARQSRVSALIEGNVSPTTKISGYGELDFLGAANTANSNESNSYTPRIRHMYTTVDWNDIGLHALVGQTWSLATLFSKGMTPRSEDIPLTIDAQYVAGFTWTRAPGLRLVKDFGDDFHVGVAAEMPQTPGCPQGGSYTTGGQALAVSCNSAPGGGGLLNADTTYSFNHIPDFIMKAAWDPTVGDRKVHLEAFGMYTDLYDRVSYATATGAAGAAGSYNTNKDTTGYAVGGSFIVPVLPKMLDVQGSVTYGRGIGHYGSSQLTGDVANPDGSLDALPELMFLVGATLHATPALDFYVYGGEEQILSSQTFAGSTAPGYGNPANYNNSGCYTDFGTCTGVTKNVWEVTGGLWDKVYDGDYGSLRVGLQYSHIQRELFPGSQTAASLALGSPRATADEARMSVRYYPFDAPAKAPPLVSKY